METLSIFQALVCFIAAGLFILLNPQGKRGIRHLLTEIFFCLGVSGVMYNSRLIRWTYIDGCLWWNIVITVMISVALLLGVYYLLKWRFYVQEQAEYRVKAARAGMTVWGFRRWRCQTLRRIHDQLLSQYGIVYDYDLQKRYNQEEAALFAAHGNNK